MSFRKFSTRSTLFSLGLLVVQAFTPAYAAVPLVDAPGIQRAIEAQERHTDSLMQTPGVVGTAVGIRGDGKPVVKIYTARPGIAEGLPGMLDGVPVRIEVSGEIFARKNPCSGPPANRPSECDDGGSADPAPIDPTARFDRPVPVGVSTGHPAITAGTIGSRMTDGGGNVYALSNNHVFAVENQAAIGDIVLQPGTYDGGSSPADDIGTVFDFEPIVFSSSANNLIDAAIALSTTDELGNATPADGYGTPKSNPIEAGIGMRVMKYGRTTGFTKGRVDAINATVNVGYGTGVARFVKQIVIRPGNFSAGGDSGSLIVSDDKQSKRQPVGLLFAGSSVITIANPIGAVLDRFGVSVDGE